MSSIRENIEQVRHNIRWAAQKAGRSPESVCLLAATKTVKPERIKEAIEAGLTLFGENRVQEAQDKIPALSDFRSQIKWHFVGHLQTNKSEQAVKLFDMIESVDNLRTAERISHFATKQEKIMPVLVQVNVGEEKTKSGVLEESLAQFVEAISKIRYIAVRGLMAIPPISDNPEDSRPYFRQLRALAVHISRLGIQNVTMNELSMGMSQDYPLAVEEGATIVRVGTEIFGDRAT